jgi:methionyl-tRNA formyltransferase
MGTPDFAVPCLEALIDDGHHIQAVFSQPDRPKGRGYKLSPPPVKELAQAHEIPVYQPTKLKDGQVAAFLRALAPDLAVVVAYGRLLPADILSAPRLGCVNVHASLLPRLRGAAPIQWSVIGGDNVTGVTTMYMDAGLDTGDLILARETPIGPDETAGELFDRLSALGARVLRDTIGLIESGTAPRMRQDDTRATYAPMIDKGMAILDFNKTPKEICCLVRGLNPAPMAKTTLDGKLIKILAAAPVPEILGKPGAILDTQRFIVACKDGAVEFLTVQPEGKKAMSGADFIRGKRLQGGEMCRAPGL